MNNKVITEEKLLTVCKSRSQRIVFASGVFDLFHEGHKYYLEQAKQQGDILVVFVHTDASTKRMKGENRPVEEEDRRLMHVASLDAVDFVLFFDEESPYRILRTFKPDVMARTGEPKGKGVKEFVENYGGKAFYAAHLDGISTTAIITNGKKLLHDSWR